MNLVYNGVLSDADICGVVEEEFLDWLGEERRTVLTDAVKGVFTTDILTIDLSFPYILFIEAMNDIKDTGDIDNNIVFKILVEYVILFRHSSNTEALGEYLSFYLENENIGYEIAVTTERLFKELIAYIGKYERSVESLIPYHWDDGLNKLTVLRI